LHYTVRDFVEKCVEERGPFGRVLEIGSLDVNGGVRDLFPNVREYWGIDIQDGPGVDQVVDATTHVTDRSYDCVVSTEVLEHVEDWRGIVKCAANAAARVVIMTCAGPGRGEHGMHGAGLIGDEYYGNIEPVDLQVELERYWYNVDVIFDDSYVPDVRAVAWGRLGTKVVYF
jgi:Methyltransferase domain